MTTTQSSPKEPVNPSSPRSALVAAAEVVLPVAQARSPQRSSRIARASARVD